MRPIRFHLRVESDLDDATAYYDEQQTGLGDSFLAEFRATTGMIANIGQVFRKADGPYRHLKLASYPYLVYYREDTAGFIVTLVINAAREPALIQSLLGERR
jgi:hypothetical protein